MAQRRLEVGGVAALGRGGAGEHFSAVDFVLPSDIDPAAVAMAIEAKLRGRRCSSAERGSSPLSVLALRPDGSVVVPADIVQRLGAGAFDRGRQCLERVIKDARAHRLTCSMGDGRPTT
jgi:hypothetical protein